VEEEGPGNVKREENPSKEKWVAARYEEIP